MENNKSLILFFIRHDSGGSIFQRRHDYSSFNALPKHMINSYHIKVNHSDTIIISMDKKRELENKTDCIYLSFFRWKMSVALEMMKQGSSFYQVMLPTK